jgi:hypothetical protein
MSCPEHTYGDECLELWAKLRPAAAMLHERKKDMARVPMLRQFRPFAVVGTIATLVLLALAVGMTSARPQSSALAERDFRVEWEPRQTVQGSAVSGYVYNTSAMTAAKVRVLIQGLDTSGRPVNSTIGYVIGTVPAFNRTYFEVCAPSAISYRVSISSFEWLKGRG